MAAGARGPVSSPDDLKLDEGDGCVFIRVHVVAGSKGESIAGLHGQSLRIKVQSRAVKGRANRDVTGLVSRVLGVRRSCVEIVSGHTSRAKRMKVSSVTAAEVRARLRRFFVGG